MESALDTSNYYFPRRQAKSQNGVEISLATNYFEFKYLNNNSKCFFKYSVDFEPELPGDSVIVRRRVWKTAADDIKEKIGHTIFNNTTCFSQKNIPDSMEFTGKGGENKELDYKIIIKWANVVDNDSLEALSLYKRFYNQMLRKLKLVQMRRNFFNKANAKKMLNNLEVWPGFNSTISMFPRGPLLNMNVTYRVLRNETVYDEIKRLESKFRDTSELKEELNNSLKGSIILTRYNNDKTYTIDDIDFSKNPNSTFTTKQGEISYRQYYKEKYGRDIHNLSQPLISNHDKKKNETIYLIPELCLLTGLTDEMRSNFNTMKDLATVTKGDANQKMKECIDLINMFLQKDECKKDIEDWGLTISNKPITLKGRKLDAGNILMSGGNNGRFNFPIETSPDIDRKIQNEMFSQPPIRKWLVMVTQKDKDACDQMLSTLQQVTDTFKYKMDQPKVIYHRSTQFKDWEQEINNNVDNSVDFVLLILPGPKGKGFNYSELKRLLTVTMQIPSQVVLASTITRSKGLRSVINKVLIQICAKVGGEPWAVDDMPFTSVPTMVVGIDVYNKGGKSIIGCCGTYNRTFTKYISVATTETQGLDLSEKIAECLKKLSNNFVKSNQIAPKHIIILRDGVAPSQIKSAEKEVKTLLSHMEDVKLTYILLNKKTSLKVFAVNHNNNFSNIPPGTLVDDVVVENEKFDFFLVSQKSNQGLSQATHYNVIYDNFGVNTEQIHLFIYKLCYLYYNWTGGIKIPAPCQYAKKLATLIGDKLSDRKGTLLPGERFVTDLRSLYYL